MTSRKMKLNTKHPEASPMNDYLFIQGPTALANELIYDSNDEREMLRAYLKTKGVAGVSALDAEQNTGKPNLRSYCYRSQKINTMVNKIKFGQIALSTMKV